MEKQGLENPRTTLLLIGKYTSSFTHLFTYSLIYYGLSPRDTIVKTKTKSLFPKSFSIGRKRETIVNKKEKKNRLL